MEFQKPGDSPGLGPEVVKRQRVAKEQAAQKVRSWIVQNEMRGVRRRCRKDSQFCQIVERQELNKILCPLQGGQEKTQRP